MCERRRFVADARGVLFDTLPPGLTTLAALTSLHLNNCFAEPQPQSFSSLSQLQRLALEVQICECTLEVSFEQDCGIRCTRSCRK
jgi:hypothetical protein